MKEKLVDPSKLDIEQNLSTSLFTKRMIKIKYANLLSHSDSKKVISLEVSVHKESMKRQHRNQRHSFAFDSVPSCMPHSTCTCGLCLPSLLQDPVQCSSKRCLGPTTKLDQLRISVQYLEHELIGGSSIHIHVYLEQTINNLSYILYSF